MNINFLNGFSKGNRQAHGTGNNQAMKASPMMATFCGGGLRASREFSAGLLRRSRSPCARPSDPPIPDAPLARTPCTKSSKVQANYYQRGGQIVFAPRKGQAVHRFDPDKRFHYGVGPPFRGRPCHSHGSKPPTNHRQQRHSSPSNLHKPFTMLVPTKRCQVSRVWRTRGPRRTAASPSAGATPPPRSPPHPRRQTHRPREA